MRGLDILVRTLSVPTAMGKDGQLWQYHPRSDRHSKIACWGILFDLLRRSTLLADYVRDGRIVFGINHEMHDFKQNRRKNLDLVICQPRDTASNRRPRTLRDLVDTYSIQLSEEEHLELEGLPEIQEGPVGTVYCALEAKACMTEHSKARPRLYDELNSSHQTIHGSSDMVVAVGFAMVNMATTFISPTRSSNDVTRHEQPRATLAVLEKLHQLPRRSGVGQEGFDALGIAVIECSNDGVGPVRLVETPPAPVRGDIFHYDAMIDRAAHVFESRFPRI